MPMPFRATSPASGNAPSAALATTFVLLGAALTLAFVRLGNAFLGTPIFSGQRLLLLSCFVALWLLIARGAKRLRRRFPGELRGSLADRYLYLLLPALFWAVLTGTVFDPDINSYLSAFAPRLHRWLLPLWVLGSYLGLRLLVRGAEALARRFTLLPDRRWRIYLAVTVFYSLLVLSSRNDQSQQPTAGTIPPAPASAPSTAVRRVVLYGVDGADWRTIDSLIGEGLLPAFARLRREGATAPLATLESGPSPKIWTTVATGRSPGVHGVLGFYDYRLGNLRFPRLDLNAASWMLALAGRKTDTHYTDWLAKPFWSVLSERSDPVLVVNWFFSYPVPPLTGMMISDRDDYYAKLCDLAGEPQSLGPAWYPSQLPLEAKEVCTQYPALVMWPLEPPHTALDEICRANVDECGYARHELRAMAAFNALWRAGRFTAGVNLTRLVDILGHFYTTAVFSNAAAPEGGFALKVSREEERWTFKAVVQAYRAVDTALTQLLDSLDDQTVLVVVSDHGWDYDGSHHAHFPPGIIALWGAGVRPQGKLEAPRVLDVAPTILALTGAPLSRELEGRVLAEAFVTAPTPTFVDAYDLPSPPPVSAAHESEQQRRYLNQLRALGYIK
jgi:hypothetical protein